MKVTLFAVFVALLMVGCGEESQKNAVQEDAKDDPRVPLLIPCEACHKGVSKKTEKCLNCGHPARDSVVAYIVAREKEAQAALARTVRSTPTKKQKVKLTQRQEKAQPSVKNTFKTKAISDIAMPDLNDLDVSNLVNPVVSPDLNITEIDNDAMRDALKRLKLSKELLKKIEASK